MEILKLEKVSNMKYLLLLIALCIFGCSEIGQQAYIMHEEKEIASVPCADRVAINQSIDTLRVSSQQLIIGIPTYYNVVVSYTYLNDGKYKVEVTPCFIKE